MLHRRTFLSGIFSALAAPAIVRAGSLMPVKSLPPELTAVASQEEIMALLRARMAQIQRITHEAIKRCLYENAVDDLPLVTSIIDQPYRLSYQGVELFCDK